MKLKHFVLAVLAFASISARAQSPRIEPTEAPGGTLEGTYIAPLQKTNGAVTEWFHFANSLNATGLGQTSNVNATLFPDSTVLTNYASSSGTVLRSVGYHALGQTFDPRFTGFDHPLDGKSSYNIDSVRFTYAYFTYLDSVSPVTDTLLVYFFNDDKVYHSYLSSNKAIAASVNFDTINKVVTGYSQLIKVPLTQADATKSGQKTVAINQSVKAGGVAAVVLSFKPGYSYSTGDTLFGEFNPRPKKRFNLFKLRRMVDAGRYIQGTYDVAKKSYTGSYNNGLVLNTAQRYGLNKTWKGLFIPGNAWNSADFDYLDMDFYLAGSVGIQEAQQPIASLNIIGNPGTAGSDIQVSLDVIKAGSYSMAIYDATGRICKELPAQVYGQGNHLINLSSNSLASGIYTIRMNGSGSGISKRIVLQ